jgi:hypothetical protein
MQPVKVSPELAGQIMQSAVSGDAAGLMSFFAPETDDEKFGALVHGLSDAYERDSAATANTLASALKMAMGSNMAQMAVQVMKGLQMASGG